MARRPLAKREAGSLEAGVIRNARLQVDKVADGVETRAVHGISGAQAFVEDAADHLDERAAKPRAAGGPDRQR